MRIGILGINSKLADLQLREKLAKTCQRLFAGQNAQHGSCSIVLLSTCNRTELYFHSPQLAETHSYLLDLLRQEIADEFDQQLYSFFGQDCFLHLCQVTSGLDSAVLGETEIQGQVKQAYELATEYIALPKELHYLFQKALMIGKKARNHIVIDRNAFGLEHAILAAGQRHFLDCTQAKILFVGASEINCKVITFLKAKQCHSLFICNRTNKTAASLASTHHLQTFDWAKLSEWHAFDWIICGTKANDFILDKKSLSIPFKGKKLLMDLSVPRNIDPKMACDSRISLFNIDQLNSNLTEQRQQIKQFLNQAQQLIQNAANLHTALFLQKNHPSYDHRLSISH